MKKLIIFIIVIIMIIFITKIWWDSQLTAVSAPVKSGPATQVFVVPKGAGVSEIAQRLKQNNLIKSELAFKIYIKQHNLSSQLQAGSYKLLPSMSVPELASALQKGSSDMWVTLIEGWRVEEMADVISSKFKVQSSKFMELAQEGYMFPDTYLFPKESTVEYVTDTLRKTFNQRFTISLQQKIQANGLTNAQGVILASIVEREARSSKVRTEVASILLKRFKIDMALNADATLQYILGYQPTEKSWWKRNLTSEDKKADSPYNTYLYAGLPPAPICNPSLSSLEAVANADSDTPYLYYYHDSKGNSYYAKTLEEHNQNVNSYP